MSAVYNHSSFQFATPISPAKEEAAKTFTALGDRQWMQIIDGKDHTHGPLVYDLGLHKGPKEPGFLASLQEGCRFAEQHLTEKTTVNFYRELHKKLCAHFKGQDTETLMDAETAGSFRKSVGRAKVHISKAFPEAMPHYEVYNPRWRDDLLEESKSQHSQEDYERSVKWVTAWEEHWEKRADEIKEYVEKRCKELGLKPFVRVNIINGEYFYLNYVYTDPQEIEHAIQVLFDHYEKQSDKLTAIADLFQLLEWLHPFPDGQGRTDLVLQSKLLSESGLNPAILMEPYTSTHSLFPEWKEYLCQGMELWKTKL